MHFYGQLLTLKSFKLRFFFILKTLIPLLKKLLVLNLENKPVHILRVEPL